MKVSNIFKIGFFSIAGLIGLVAFFGLWFTVDSGEMIVYQNPATETLEAFTETGFHIAMPFVSDTYSYNKVATVSFVESEGEGSSVNGPANVRFPDNYTGTVEATFRFELPTDEPTLLKLHKDFRSYKSVVNKLLLRTAIDVMGMAATQFTSEDFFQGGLPKYRADISDFLNNGVPVMEKKQVEIKVAALEEEGSEVGGKTKKRKQFVEIFVPVMKDGAIVRQDAPLKNYGIRVTQVTMGMTTPAMDLQKLLVRTKEIFAERRAIRAEQENQRQARITTRLTGERAREEAEQKALLEKAVAVVGAQKKVELAEQEKERVLVKKQQLLEAAEKDKSIQLARAIAAKAEAQAIRLTGLARADVTAAELRAKNNPAYLAELQRDMAIKVSANMTKMKITMPNIMFGSNGNGAAGNSSAGTLLDLLSLQLAKQVGK